MGGRTRAYTGVAALLTILVAGCAPNRGQRSAPMPRAWAPTLLVVSRAIDHVAVRINGFRVGTVTRGSSCLRIPAVDGSVRVELVSLSGRASAPEPLLLAPGRHWRLELGPDGRLARDVLSLGPTSEACAPGR